MSATCTCGCGTIAEVTEAREPCACGCECCEVPDSPVEEREQLRHLRDRIDERLAELDGSS
jgi:hypothetical protein